MKILTTFLLAASLLCTAACVKPKAGDVDVKPWTLLTPSGGRIECERGTLYVPENRANPKSRVIGIGFLRIKALRPTGVPPTIHLPGGPGESFLEKLNANKPNEAERVINAGFDEDLAFYRPISDVIFFDQRGYSQLGDVLTFPFRTKPLPLDKEAPLSQRAKEYVVWAERAIAHYQQKGFDLSGYNVKECAADVNDLCRALGYRQVILVGQSFGSQWAFATIRLFPGIVARALLSGVEPLSCGIDIPSEVYGAMKRMWKSAGPDPRLPPGGFDEVVRAILRELPRTVTLYRGTPKAKDVRVGRDDFHFFLSLFGADELLEMYQGHYDALAGLTVRAREELEDKRDLIGPLIDGSLSASAERWQRVLADSSLELVGRWGIEEYLAMEKRWPTADVGDNFRAEIKTKVPVVCVQGAWDVRTPVENLEVVRDFFENSRTVVVTNGPHAAYVKARRSLPAVKDAVAEFLTTGSMTNLKPKVTLPVCKVPEPPSEPAPAQGYQYAR